MNQNAPLFQRRQILLAGLVGMALPSWASAQSAWPSRPVRLVVPYPAGGPPDGFSRVIAQQLGAQLSGATFTVENRPGASGLLGARAVSQGAADGHSLVYATSGHVTLAAMNPRFPLLRELKPVVRLSSSPFVVLVSAESPHKTMGDLIKFVQANPGKVNCGTAGPGSAAHLAVEYLEETTKNFKTTLVPFKGAVESINAILGGQIDMTIGVLGAAVQLVRAGKLRALAVTTPRRVALLPDLPTVAESGGGSDYAFTAWGGFMMHADTPDDLVARVESALKTAMQNEEVRKFVQSTGSMPDISESPAAFGAQLARDITRETSIVKRLGMTMEQ
ncbi:MAG: Bug family tripartite tricarboxylate transporter substrate binding protein [Brachymonas sp.]